MGYAPADDPQIAIYVVVDRVNDEKQDNVRCATELTRDILTEVLPYLGIYMTEALSEDEMKELEERQLEITNRYTAQPEESSEEEPEESGEDPEGAGTEGDGEGSEPEPTVNTPWKDFPIDPVTGYAVNPETGESVDPDTGDPIDSTFSAFE